MVAPGSMSSPWPHRPKRNATTHLSGVANLQRGSYGCDENKLDTEIFQYISIESPKDKANIGYILKPYLKEIKSGAGEIA